MLTQKQITKLMESFNKLDTDQQIYINNDVMSCDLDRFFKIEDFDEVIANMYDKASDIMRYCGHWFEYQTAKYFGFDGYAYVEFYEENPVNAEEIVTTLFDDIWNDFADDYEDLGLEVQTKIIYLMTKHIIENYEEKNKIVRGWLS